MKQELIYNDDGSIFMSANAWVKLFTKLWGHPPRKYRHRLPRKLKKKTRKHQ